MNENSVYVFKLPRFNKLDPNEKDWLANRGSGINLLELRVGTLKRGDIFKVIAAGGIRYLFEVVNPQKREVHILQFHLPDHMVRRWNSCNHSYWGCCVVNAVIKTGRTFTFRWAKSAKTKVFDPRFIHLVSPLPSPYLEGSNG